MGKIALVNDFLNVYGGAERVLSVLHQLFPEAPIYTSFSNPETVAKYFPEAEIHTTYLQNSWFKKYPALLLGKLPRAFESFDFSEYDLVLSTSGAFCHGIITGPDTIHICYCHTPMRYAWDYQLEYLREKGFDKGLKFIIAENQLNKLRIWDQVAAERADVWYGNSQTVVKRINKFYRKPAEVLYPPVDTEYFDYKRVELFDQVKPYFVSASRLTPNKKIDLMIEAAAENKFQLKIIGSGTDQQRLKDLAQKLDAQVEFTGQISEEEKLSILANAKAFLFTTEDDFGIAPVEALALGVPVLAFGRGGATEYVLDGQNGYLFHEQTSQSLSQAIQDFQQKGLPLNRSEIRQTAVKFSTQNFQQNISNIINNALQS